MKEVREQASAWGLVAAWQQGERQVQRPWWCGDVPAGLKDQPGAMCLQGPGRGAGLPEEHRLGDSVVPGWPIQELVLFLWDGKPVTCISFFFFSSSLPPSLHSFLFYFNQIFTTHNFLIFTFLKKISVPLPGSSQQWNLFLDSPQTPALPLPLSSLHIHLPIWGFCAERQWNCCLQFKRILYYGS